MITLRPYQQQILGELSHLASIGLFMGTGTGKTFTSIERALQNGTEKLLVVCPKNVVEQWKSVLTTNYKQFKILEFKKSWTGAQKNTAITAVHKYNTIVVNFDIVSKLDNLKYLINDNWTIIIDESHRIKDTGTKRNPVKVTKAILDLRLKTPWKIILTATPTQGDYGGYIDYYSQLKFLGYLDMPESDFKRKYCVINEKLVYGIPFPIQVIVGYKYTDEIDEILKACCRRYTAKFGDFDPQHNKILIPRCSTYPKVLREKTYNEILLSNSARKRIGLKTLATGVIAGIGFNYDKYIYEDNTNKLDWLADFLTDTDEVVAVYYQYNVELHSLEKLMKKLKKRYIVVNGETENAYKLINDGGYDVVLGQFQAASQSLDGLQHKCHIMVHFALAESSLLHTQSLGRINRDGQTKVPMYYYLVMENTIEDRIYKMIERKIEYNENVLDKIVIEEETE